MLDHETRIAVLRLRSEGHGMRAIARVLNVSRNAVRRVIEDGGAEVPTQEQLVEDLAAAGGGVDLAGLLEQRADVDALELSD